MWMRCRHNFNRSLDSGDSAEMGHVNMNWRVASFAAGILLSLSTTFSVTAEGDTPYQAPRIEQVQLTSSQSARLLMDAKKYARVITRGSEAELASILARMYEKGLNDPYARGLLFGPSEVPDKRGFREILNGMS